MSTSAAHDLPTRRIDTILSYTALGLFALSIASFFVILIGSGVKMDFNTPVGRLLAGVVYIAPIVAFILIMIVLFSSFVRRARANKAR